MEKHGVCNLGVVPMRSDPSDRSEMVSQLLFGESFTIIDNKKDWFLVECDYDHYQGWIDKKQALVLSAKEYEKYCYSGRFITGNPLTKLTASEGDISFLIPAGSLLVLEKPGIFRIGNTKYTIDDPSGLLSEGTFKTLQELTATSMFLNTPYLWGGKSIFGIDCSGLVQTFYKLCGIVLPRDASQQVLQGSPVAFLSEAQPGDLAFFDDEEGNVIHTGILISTEKIMHASGYVRIDHIDHHGIFNVQTGKYSHKLRTIKKIL